MSFPQPDASQAYKRLIDSLEEAASCARQLSFRRGQPMWLKVDERLVQMRKQVIMLAEAAEKNFISGLGDIG
jgi:hypothetical protein